MDLGLEGKVAFITGASKGIGKECARVLAEEGATVVITARGRELLEQTAQELSDATGQRVVPIAGDMSKPEDVEARGQPRPSTPSETSTSSSPAPGARPAACSRT